MEIHPTWMWGEEVTTWHMKNTIKLSNSNWKANFIVPGGFQWGTIYEAHNWALCSLGYISQSPCKQFTFENWWKNGVYTKKHQKFIWNEIMVHRGFPRPTTRKPTSFTNIYSKKEWRDVEVQYGRTSMGSFYPWKAVIYIIFCK